MARASTIKQLPPEIRAEVDALLAEGRYTIDQVVEHLRALGEEVSRSAVGRYKQNIDQVAARLRESREIADAMIQGIGPAAAEGKTGRLLVEMIQNVAFNFLIDRGDGKSSPQDIMNLGRAIKDLAQAESLDTSRILRIREQVAKEAAEAAEGAAKQKGLSKDTAKFIYDQVLGVRKKS